MEITNIPNRIKKKLELVIDKSKFYFKELENEEYFFDGAYIDEEVAVDHVINIRFINESLRLAVILSYAPIDIYNEDSDFLVCIIKRLNNKNDQIDLYRLLTRYYSNLSLNLDYFLEINLDKNGSFEENLDITLQLNLMYLLECAKDVLKGKFWADDLKFQWTEELDKLLYEKQKDIIYGKKGKKNKKNDRG